MLRKFIILLIVSITSCQEATLEPIQPNNPKPTEKDSLWGDYFPNSLGTFWEYNVIINGKMSYILKITIEQRILINNKISASVWLFETNNDKYKNYVAIIQDSVFFYTRPNEITDAKYIIKQYILPLNIFRNWEARNLDVEFGSDRMSGGAVIGKINVPAGNFDNVIEIERIVDAKDEKSHQWLNFVPGIGLIRFEKIDNSLNQNTIWELMNYEIK